LIDRILLDMDGVLVDFLGGACQLHGKTYDGHPHDPAGQTEQKPWNIEPLFEMTAPELWNPMGRDFWFDLEPLPWCHEVVATLTAKFGEDNICLLTSPIRTDGCIDGKMDWIRKHLPQFRRQFLVGPAKQFAASPRHCLVDDHTKNVEAFKDAGGHTFLFPAPYNPRFREHPVKAMKEWVDALDVLGRG
jgi:5'(3')-deoxyribonucleotidase